MKRNGKERKLILVTNDDGIDAKGIHELIDLLSPLGDIICVAPDAPRSAQSMALTVGRPLRITRHEDWHGAKMYSVNGTPVDCVKLSAHTVIPRKPDLLVSGINHGSNASVNVLYSGTMGAVMEGCVLGIPSVGFSLTSHDPDADFSKGKEIIKVIAETVLRDGLPPEVCLNVNIPDNVCPKGIRITQACKGQWSEEYKRHSDAENGDFYILEGSFINSEPDNTLTDEWSLKHGYVSVTPTLIDVTAKGVELPCLNLGQ